MWCCGKVDVVVPGVAPSVAPTEVKATHDIVDEILVDEAHEEETDAEAFALAEAMAKEEELTQDTVVGILGIAFLFTVAYLMLNSKDNEPYRIQHHIDL
jgi:hypothetical protein